MSRLMSRAMAGLAVLSGMPLLAAEGTGEVMNCATGWWWIAPIASVIGLFFAWYCYKLMMDGYCTIGCSLFSLCSLLIISLLISCLISSFIQASLIGCFLILGLILIRSWKDKSVLTTLFFALLFCIESFSELGEFRIQLFSNSKIGFKSGNLQGFFGNSTVQPGDCNIGI